ncbi:MAG: hypothetical protein AAFX46_00110 [Cyanobacteria bacterium J06636_27]
MQLWHTTGAVAAQPDVILSRSGMLFEINCGANLVLKSDENCAAPALRLHC